MIDFGATDARKAAKKSSNAPSFPSEELYIDFCFVSKNRFVTERFDVGTDCEGSDHYPLFIQVTPIQNN